MKKITLDYKKIKPLQTASHAKGVSGRRVSKNNPSEWAWAFAATKFPRGAEISIEDFRIALIEAMTYEVVSKMIDDYEAIMTINDKNEIVVEIVQ